VLTIGAMIRDDYLIRLIRQAVQALARIVSLNRRKQYDAALAEAGDGWDRLLDVPREVVDVIDDRSLIELLRDPDKLRVAAQLLAEESIALRGKGDPVNGAVTARRAIVLYAAARARDPSQAEHDDEMILELSRAVPINAL
jgi:hypothetical protein